MSKEEIEIAMAKAEHNKKFKKQSGLEALKEYRSQQQGINVHADDYLDIIEEELKQAEENEKWLNVFENALTIERQIPPELEIKESEKGNTYVFREAVKIHENRIEEMLKKSLREWVLKNAFPKELKALEIIKEKGIDYRKFLESKNCDEYNKPIIRYNLIDIKPYTKEEYDLLKEIWL